MNTTTFHKRQWRVGELAEAAGMTVRALHHYEHAGLFASPRRTEGGHRVYDEAAVERLYRIRALRGLGMSLDEIRRVLDDGAALADLLRMHLDRVELEVERLTLLRDRLRGITRAGAPAGTGELLATLDAMSRVERRAHARRRGSSDVESRWREAGEALRACMEAGDDPASAPAKAAARRARALLHAFAGGDEAMLQALARLRQVDPPRNLAGWDPALTRYLDRALAALDRE